MLRAAPPVRAAAVLADAQKLGVHVVLQPTDVTAPHERLLLGFLAELMALCPGLGLPDGAPGGNRRGGRRRARAGELSRDLPRLALFEARRPTRTPPSRRRAPTRLSSRQATSREERLRNGYTSLGHAVESGSFLEDCRTGLPLLRTMATLQPGLVDWVRSA